MYVIRNTLFFFFWIAIQNHLYSTLLEILIFSSYQVILYNNRSYSLSSKEWYLLQLHTYKLQAMFVFYVKCQKALDFLAVLYKIGKATQ